MALAGLLWSHGSGAPWVHGLGQPRAARRASLLPGGVLDTGRLCPRLPNRDSSVPSSHQASRSGILSSCGPLSPAAISTRGPGRSHAALWGFQTHRRPGSPSLCRPSLLVPWPRSSGPGLLLTAAAPHYVGGTEEKASVPNTEPDNVWNNVKANVCVLLSPEMLFSLTANFLDDRHTWAFGNLSFL